MKKREWWESVEGIMREKGLSREDAQFMYDLEHDLVQWDEKHIPAVMRAYGFNQWSAREFLARATGRVKTTWTREDTLTFYADDD